MNIYKNYFLILCMGLLCSSCSKDVEDVVTGWWTIDRNNIIYKGEDLTFCLLNNSITFEEDKCILPTISKNCGFKNVLEEYGTWKFINKEKPYIIEIYTENEVFSGKHKLSFELVENGKLLKMIIESNDLYIKCSRVMFDVNENRSIVKKIID